MDRNMQERFRSCFEDWIDQQESDLDELLKTMPSSSGGENSDQTPDESKLKELEEKGLKHFEEYAEKRMNMAKEYAPTFFCPIWCSSFENSFLWLGGCRPTMAIRLVYALAGSDLEARIEEIVRDGGKNCSVLLLLSGRQLNQINELHCRTLKEETRLSDKMATLQEDVADEPLLPFVKRMQLGRKSQKVDESYSKCEGASGSSSSRNEGEGENLAGQVEAVMDSYAEKQGRILQEADVLRIKTMREIVMEILTPLQASELLAAGKQLHLSVHEWSRKREHQRGGS